MTNFPVVVLSAVVVALSTAGGQGTPGEGKGGGRAELENRFRARAERLVQQRLALTDQQMGQLRQSNQKFGPQLVQVLTQERTTRQQLRAEMQSATPNQARVSTLIDTSLRLQKQRLSIVEAEQNDLATFMTPVQRARYLALQAQFRNRAQELARQNGGSRRGGRRAGPFRR